MKTVYTVACLFLAMSQFAFASSGVQYFNGAEFEEAQPVQMIGVNKTVEDTEREYQISHVLESNRQKFTFCYEKVLSNGPLNDVKTTFYFSVDAGGVFSNLTADVISSADQARNSQRLISCVSKMFNTFRAPVYSADRVFKYDVSFSQR